MPYKDKLKQKENNKLWRTNNKYRVREREKRYRFQIKKLVFSKYSSDEIKCQCCGEKNLEFLSIDHIDGGGNKLRKEHGSGYLYYWLVKNNFPKGYRVLCHNCNQSYGIYKRCPHQNNMHAGVVYR